MDIIGVLGYSSTNAPPVLISCVSTVPSLPANFTMTRHFITLSRPAVFDPAHATPGFETVFPQRPEQATNVSDNSRATKAGQQARH
jgi:hypothetical protein